MKIEPGEELSDYCARLNVTALDAYSSYPQGTREEMIELASCNNLLSNVSPAIRYQIESRNDHRRLVGLKQLQFHQLLQEIMRLQD